MSVPSPGQTAGSMGLHITVMCCLLYLLSYFLRNCVAVIAPDIQHDLGFTAANISLISGSTMLAYGLMQLPSGILADAFGGRRVIIALLGIAAAGSLLLAISPSTEPAVGGRFLVGVGAAIYVPCMTLLAASLPRQKYSKALGFVNASGGFGGILAATPMTLLSHTMGWRGAVMATILLIIAVLCLFTLSTRNLPVQKPATKPSLRTIMSGIYLVVGNRRFWPFCLWQMTAIGVSFMLITLWWVPFLVEGAELTRVQAANILSMAAVLLLVVPPGAAILSDYLHSRRKVIIAASVGCVACSLFWLIPGKSYGPVLHTAQALLFSMATAGGAIINFTMVRETFPSHVVGTASGCVNMIYPIWAAILQIIFGLILSTALHNGIRPASAYSLAFILVTANMLVALVCSLLMKETFNQ